MTRKVNRYPLIVGVSQGVTKIDSSAVNFLKVVPRFFHRRERRENARRVAQR